MRKEQAESLKSYLEGQGYTTGSVFLVDNEFPAWRKSYRGTQFTSWVECQIALNDVAWEDIPLQLAKTPEDEWLAKEILTWRLEVGHGHSH